jgi:hypothetical protein
MALCLSSLYAHENICKNELVGKKKKKNRKNIATAQIGTKVRACVFNVGLLARSRFASRRSFIRPTRSGFSVVFLGPRPNSELVPKFHIAVHALLAALPIVILKILPYKNVTFALDHPVHG